MILNKEEIKNRIMENGLVENFVDLDKQLTPNGLDLTVDTIFEFLGCGSIDFDNTDRKTPKTKALEWCDEWISLQKGFYKIMANESINMPLDLIGIARPRSSLARMGATVDTGVWDAGFKGRSEFLLIVGNKKGIRMKKNARIVQLIFNRIKGVKEGYKGIYLSETLS